MAATPYASGVFLKYLERFMLSPPDCNSGMQSVESIDTLESIDTPNR
jgi:hypothetical protein